MPRIEPPPDDDCIYDYTPQTTTGIEPAEFERIKDYLAIDSWFCADCGLKNFGRNQYCAFCWIRFGRKDRKERGK